MNKTELRRSLLHQRQALNFQQWQTQSKLICEQIKSQELFQKARTILVYLSHRQEPDLESLWADYSQNHSQHYPQKKWGLPRCQGKELIWHEWQPRLASNILTNNLLTNNLLINNLLINDTNNIVKNRSGISEPKASLPLVPVEEVDLILVPCVGCDRSGYRLGYGGGYYDRLLSQPPWQNKPTLGITFSFAYLEKLPISPWDVPLQGVCTEKEVSCRIYEQPT